LPLLSVNLVLLSLTAALTVMVAVPPAFAVILPVLFTVATFVLLLLQLLAVWNIDCCKGFTAVKCILLNT